MGARSCRDSAYAMQASCKRMIYARRRALQINECFGWLRFNGLLFAALGFAWEKSDARFFEIVLFRPLGIASSFFERTHLDICSMTAQRRCVVVVCAKKYPNTTAVR